MQVRFQICSSTSQKTFGLDTEALSCMSHRDAKVLMRKVLTRKSPKEKSPKLNNRVLTVRLRHRA